MRNILHFTADWCVPCQKMKPVIDQFIADNKDVQYHKIDIEKDFQTTEKYSVKGIPTLIALDNTEVIGRHTGIANISKIESLFGRGL